MEEASGEQDLYSDEVFDTEWEDRLSQVSGETSAAVEEKND